MNRWLFLIVTCIANIHNIQTSNQSLRERNTEKKDYEINNTTTNIFGKKLITPRSEKKPAFLRSRKKEYCTYYNEKTFTAHRK